jgi:hypothetical protein
MDAHRFWDSLPDITARSKSATDLETCIACVSRTSQHIARPQQSCSGSQSTPLLDQEIEGNKKGTTVKMADHMSN